MHVPRSEEAKAADRARYEEHQRKGLQFSPKSLPEAASVPAPPVPKSDLRDEQEIPDGWTWAARIHKGETIRVAKNGPNASVALVAWNADDPSERLNLPDTVKLQWTTALGTGRVLFSDMSRVLFSITADSSSAHDPLTGGLDADAPTDGPHHRGRSNRANLLLIANKFGLDKRDIPAPLCLFAPVRTGEDGGFTWRSEMLNGEDWIELRAEMPLLVGLSNCAHPLDPERVGERASVTVSRIAAQPVGADDLCRTATAEAIRGFENNAVAEL